jgi:hypothetical protein
MVMAVADREPVIACSFQLSGGPEPPESVLNFVEGETECTSECDLGQFSIFGAIEENGDYGL